MAVWYIKCIPYAYHYGRLYCFTFNVLSILSIPVSYDFQAQTVYETREIGINKLDSKSISCVR